MEATKTATTYSPQFKERTVRVVLEHQGENASEGAAICSIAAKIGRSGEALRGWLRQRERDASPARSRLSAGRSASINWLVHMHGLALAEDEA